MQGSAKRSRHIMNTQAPGTGTQSHATLFDFDGILVSFGNYLLKRYGVMVHSSDGKNVPIYQREVGDADLCNWKEESKSTTNGPVFSLGDTVKVFLMPEGENSFPGFTGKVTAVHGYPGKIKYDVELKFAGGFSSRIYNVDEVLVSADDLVITSVPPSRTFKSRFNIGDEVQYTTERQVRKMGPEEPEWFDGKISAVKFTEAKVWYDVLDDYDGKIYEGVPSDYVVPSGKAVPVFKGHS